MRIPFIKSIGIIFFALFLASSAEKPKCDDFLSAWQIKPKPLRFLGCKKIEKAPAVVLESSYAIEGTKAKAVEELLHRQFKMERLRFVCCGWETRPAFYTDADGVLYEIKMYSYDEFTGDPQWEAFSEFRITVERYIVLP